MAVATRLCILTFDPWPVASSSTSSELSSFWITVGPAHADNKISSNSVETHCYMTDSKWGTSWAMDIAQGQITFRPRRPLSAELIEYTGEKVSFIYKWLWCDVIVMVWDDVMRSKNWISRLEPTARCNLKLTWLDLTLLSSWIIQFLLRMTLSHTITMTSHHNHLYINNTFFLSFSWRRPTWPKRPELFDPLLRPMLSKFPICQNQQSLVVQSK